METQTGAAPSESKTQVRMWINSSVTKADQEGYSTLFIGMLGKYTGAME